MRVPWCTIAEELHEIKRQRAHFCLSRDCASSFFNALVILIELHKSSTLVRIPKNPSWCLQGEHIRFCITGPEAHLSKGARSLHEQP